MFFEQFGPSKRVKDGCEALARPRSLRNRLGCGLLVFSMVPRSSAAAGRGSEGRRGGGQRKTIL